MTFMACCIHLTKSAIQQTAWTEQKSSRVDLHSDWTEEAEAKQSDWMSLQCKAQMSGKLRSPCILSWKSLQVIQVNRCSTISCVSFPYRCQAFVVVERQLVWNSGWKPFRLHQPYWLDLCHAGVYVWDFKLRDGSSPITLSWRLLVFKPALGMKLKNTHACLYNTPLLCPVARWKAGRRCVLPCPMKPWLLCEFFCVSKCKSVCEIPLCTETMHSKANASEWNHLTTCVCLSLYVRHKGKEQIRYEGAKTPQIISFKQLLIFLHYRATPLHLC